jgi:hypothetical protein
MNKKLTNKAEALASKLRKSFEFVEFEGYVDDSFETPLIALWIKTSDGDEKTVYYGDLMGAWNMYHEARSEVLDFHL